MIKKVHYHEHAETCTRCAVARDAADPMKFITDSEKETKLLFDNSCEMGQAILTEFWLNYKDEE